MPGRFKASKADVEDMIWEVDEDCDRCIDWEEFQSMFYRVRHDKTGWEPRRFFTVVEFMMHDKDMSGTIDMDECMEILFRRFGKEQVRRRPPTTCASPHCRRPAPRTHTPRAAAPPRRRSSSPKPKSS